MNKLNTAVGLGTWLLLAAGVVGEPAASEKIADLVLTGGTVWTMNESQPRAEAVAVRAGRIVAVGDADEMRDRIGAQTRVIPLNGNTVIPGFVEGHAHFTGIGAAAMQLELRGHESWEDIVALVKEAVQEAKPGELIRGRGWHQNDWKTAPRRSVGDLPIHDNLSVVSPHNPVLLTHASGHMVFANERAMEMAGITAATPDPRGGEIVRDAEGNPTGAFRQRASGLLAPVSRLWNPDTEAMARLAADEALSKGVTTIQDAGSSLETIRTLREMDRREELPVRLWVMMRDSNARLAQGLDEIADWEESAQFAVGGIKKAIDGALGTHGAWLLEPYHDRPDHSGFNTTPIEDIEEAARLAIAHDRQLCVHAIGDRATGETLDLFERVWAETGVEGSSRRWRIEHAQTIHPDDVSRFAALGVIASMQGVHATSDGPWVPQRLGETRAREAAYVWRSLLDAGAIIVNGTDAPVEDLDPIANFYASVTRAMDGNGRFFAEQRMTREEALRSYTRDAAYGIFREDRIGSLAPGMLADMVVLSQDLLTVPEEKIPDTVVLYTIVGGEIRYVRMQ